MVTMCLSEYGYEVIMKQTALFKNAATQVRAKQNAGDITHDLPSTGIVGRIGHEYENLKNYREYEANGEKLLNVIRDRWERDALE